MNNPKLDHIPDAKPSATVVMLRDRNSTLEVLMLQKNQTINYGGSWVFPGGVCDPEDFEAARQNLDTSAVENVAKITACREAMEEASLELRPNDLSAFAHWTTPKFRVKRYATWFFLNNANDTDHKVSIDEGEIIEARWFTPNEAITAQAEGKIELNGPSFVTLSQLSEFQNTEQAIASYSKREVEYFVPQGHKIEGGFVTLYVGDRDYGAKTLPSIAPTEGAHRLYMIKDKAWEYLQN